MQLTHAFMELDKALEPEVKAVAQEKAQARMADVLAAVDVDKYMKVCIESPLVLHHSLGREF